MGRPFGAEGKLWKGGSGNLEVDAMLPVELAVDIADLLVLWRLRPSDDARAFIEDPTLFDAVRDVESVKRLQVLEGWHTFLRSEFAWNRPLTTKCP